MRIELADLEEGRNEFAHEYAPGELVFDDSRVALMEAPSVSGAIQVSGKRLLVTGRVRASAQLECDRCLRPVPYPVDSRFQVKYVTPEEYEAQQAVELSEDDLESSIFDGESLLVDDLVAEELLLALPDHVLCGENCKGICAVCGGDKNAVECTCETQQIDPRWEELKRLVNGK
ncbi:MAG TPA: DUF177 domain-containing protein [Pyrinomonadaceae bacterium]|nr:DUF177 domain-containing protein [Pyrinomonadaceae bacterium]